MRCNWDNLIGHPPYKWVRASLIAWALMIVLTIVGCEAYGKELTGTWRKPMMVIDGRHYTRAVLYHAQYYRNDGEAEPYWSTVTADTTVTVECEPGYAYRLKVAGIDEDGNIGPFSPWSPAFFVDLPAVCNCPSEEIQAMLDAYLEEFKIAYFHEGHLNITHLTAYTQMMSKVNKLARCEHE